MSDKTGRKFTSSGCSMAENIAGFYGENVFSIKTMRSYLSERAYRLLITAIRSGNTLDSSIADEVADAMKTWALEKGATHFTHWFQPLTGATAEKHDSFVTPDGEGGAIMQFSGDELIQGQPDASSFPSGGLRATFEARGYTAWDPTSPAFIKEGRNGCTLCIPTVFCGYHGESLDKKTPLLRSINALSEQVCRLGELFGIKTDGNRAYAMLGAEQEYFLIDRTFYESRLDLLQTGRTLFGRRPAKHQQLDDHYFGAIKSRVMNFMCDLDREMWRLGVPAKTRHNEVCPAQFEITPVYEELNLAIDHNMIMMEVMRELAEQHDLACLLHEKPFAGVNGSGKHNNWSIVGPDGKNWLTPGDNPHENAKFLTLICAIIKAVDVHADLLCAVVASAGNDLRLGASEAPPGIISIFLGDQLYDIVEQLAEGKARRSKSGGTIEIGGTLLPSLPRDATDRNRTSPFAFTGNKFEFRAVGASQNCASANVVLNIIVTEALDDICARLEADLAKGDEFNASLQDILQNIVKEHKRILFNGDNYSEDWKQEAVKRKLANLKNAPDALKAIKSQKSIALFEKYKVLTRKELEARYDIYQKIYDQTVAIEGHCAVTIVKTMIIPGVLRYQAELWDAIDAMVSAGETDVGEVKKLFKEVTDELSKTLVNIRKLEGHVDQGTSADMLAVMGDLRNSADKLEGIVPDDLWPLPSYTEMMFMM